MAGWYSSFRGPGNFYPSGIARLDPARKPPSPPPRHLHPPQRRPLANQTLNWAYRFPSPISYWETAYYGRTFIVFEYLLDALIIGFFMYVWWQRKQQPREKKA